MAREKLPAHLRLENYTNNDSKEDLKKMVDQEKKMRGDNDKVSIPPDTLSDLGKACYTFIIEEIANIDMLSNLDIPMIEQTADCLEKMKILDDTLNEDGMFIEARDSRGNEFIKEHPAVKTKMSYINQFRYLSAQLGMSPASRAQMAQANVEAKKEEAKPINKLMELKNKNKGVG